MSRSNYDKPFYVDVGTSIVAIRCASNHDVVVRYDHVWHPHTLKLAKDVCDRMNREVEIGRPLRNCDIGSSEEQEVRFSAFCLAHRMQSEKGCTICPCHTPNECSCEFVWSQMPYEEERG